MKAILSALVVLGLAVSAQALTLKEKKQVKEWNDYLNDPGQSYVGTVKEKCGKAIPLTMDDEFATPFMKERAHAAAYCDATRSAISTMCEDATSKDEIVKKITKITCKLGKPETADLKLSGGNLVFTVGINASNLDDKVKEFLGDNL